MSDEPTAVPFREGNEALLDDDNFHVPESDHWWEHETFWFWFFNPERKLGCWSYHYVRPTIGVAGGGVFVFDDTAWFHMETPYYVNYTNTRLAEDRDLARLHLSEWAADRDARAQRALPAHLPRP